MKTFKLQFENKKIGMISKMFKTAYQYIRILLFICLLGVGCTLKATPVPTTPDLEMLSHTSSPAVTNTPEPTQTPTRSTPEIQTLPLRLPTGLIIEFWHPWSGEMANLLSDLTDEFNQKNNYGITVNTYSHSDNRVIIEDLEVSWKEGDNPDLMALPNDYFQILEKEQIFLWDLDTLIQSEQWGLNEEVVSSFFPIFWNTVMDQEKRLGVPAYYSGYYLFYNLSWAEEMGFDGRPLTLDDFEEQSCSAAILNLYDGDPGTNGTGGYLYSADALAILSWMRVHGGAEMRDSQDNWQIVQTGDIDASEYLYDLYLKDCAWTGKQTQPYQYFSDRLALFYSGKLDEIFIQKKVNENNESLDNWTLMPYPSNAGKPVVFIEGQSYAISAADADHAIAAWEFVKWLLAPENQARMVETDGVYPLSTLTLPYLEDFQLEYPAWSDALQFLALADRTPDIPEWQMIKDVISDLAWQLVRFTTKKDDIPSILNNAQTIIEESIIHNET